MKVHGEESKEQLLKKSTLNELLYFIGERDNIQWGGEGASLYTRTISESGEIRLDQEFFSITSCLPFLLLFSFVVSVNVCLCGGEAREWAW